MVSYFLNDSSSIPRYDYLVINCCCRSIKHSSETNNSIQVRSTDGQLRILRAYIKCTPFESYTGMSGLSNDIGLSSISIALVVSINFSNL